MTDTPTAPPSASAPSATVPPATLLPTTRRRHRQVMLAAILLSNFMIATEATIVATAMPRIVGELGGFHLYTWVFSAYLLAQCTLTLIFGRLSDLFGRKPVLLGGLAVFLLGSLLAGSAGTMGWLVAFRLLQGIGAGAVQPMALTLVGDLYTAAERPRIQGYSAGVWAGAAVIGPLVGGIITDHFAWGWVFWVNLPIGVATIAAVVLCLHETVTPRAARIDYAGALLFTVAIAGFLLLLTLNAAGAGLLVPLGALALAAAVLFVMQELRAPDPMIPIALWRRPLIAASNAASLLTGMALVGMTTVMPLYLQGVMHRSPVIAGSALTTLIVGWTVAMVGAARSFRVVGIARTLRLGCLPFPLGAALLLPLGPGSSALLPAIGGFGMGIGMGLISIASIVLVQERIEISLRGSATASIIFARSFGNAIGATVIGALLSLGMAHFGQGDEAARLQDILNRPGGLETLEGAPALRRLLDAALHWSFWGILVTSTLSTACAWFMGGPEQADDRRI